MTPVVASPLPEWIVDHCRVTKTSTISIKKNAYSVPSRLIGQVVRVHIYDDKLKIFLGKNEQLEVPRCRGNRQSNINYRHVIWSMLNKPGAFRRFKYREEMFPTLLFRRTYDVLGCHFSERKTDLEYLRILHLAAAHSQKEVETAITLIFEDDSVPTFDAVKNLTELNTRSVPVLMPLEVDIDLNQYDELIEEDRDDTHKKSSTGDLP
jgi:hypothetical protein